MNLIKPYFINEQTKYKREDILSFFGDPEHPTFKTDYALVKAMVRIYMFQTEYEKNAEATTEYNKVGFSGVDGELLTSFSNQVLQRGTLSPKQMLYVRKKVPKYARQLAKHLTAGTISKTEDDHDFSKIMTVMNNWVKKNKFKYDKNGKLLGEEKLYLIGVLLEIETQKATAQLIQQIKTDINSFRPGGSRGEITTTENEITVDFKHLGDWEDDEESSSEYEDPESDMYDPGWREDNDQQVWAPGEHKKYLQKFMEWAKRYPWFSKVKLQLSTSEKNWCEFIITLN